MAFDLRDGHMIARHLPPFNARKKKSRVWHFFSLPGKLKGTRDDRNTMEKGEKTECNASSTNRFFDSASESQS